MVSYGGGVGGVKKKVDKRVRKAGEGTGGTWGKIIIMMEIKATMSFLVERLTPHQLKMPPLVPIEQLQR